MKQEKPVIANKIIVCILTPETENDNNLFEQLKNLIASNTIESRHLLSPDDTEAPGKEYTENNLLRYFIIPNAYVGGLKFDLKFAVNSTDETETVTEINYQKLFQFLNQLAVSVTETAITTVLYASEDSILSASGNYRKLQEKEAVLKTEFHDYLSGVLRDTLFEKAVNEVDEDGNPDPNRIFEISMDVINTKFFQHPELNLSGNMGEQQQFEKVKESCSSFVNTLIRHSCKSVNVLEICESEVFDISVDAESLSKISPESVQQISFDINLRNYQISKMDTEAGNVDCIIPANG